MTTLEQRIEGRAEGVEIALRRCPGCLQHVGKILAEGADIPFRRQADAGMRHADAQPAGDIGGAVIAGGQAVEIAAVRLLQPATVASSGRSAASSGSRRRYS